MQKARSQRTPDPKTRASSYRLWACGFRLSFTPRPGVLFTCPSRYSFTIGHTGVFRLGGWSPQLHARLLESGVTQELHYHVENFAYRAVTVSGAPFQETSARSRRDVCGSYNPALPKEYGLGSAPFARRYYGHLG